MTGTTDWDLSRFRDEARRLADEVRSLGLSTVNGVPDDDLRRRCDAAAQPVDLIADHIEQHRLGPESYIADDD